jgi:hypothetical protein
MKNIITNIFNAIKAFIKHPKFEAFLWQTLNGFLAISVVIITDLDWKYAPLIIAALNYLTKYINTHYLKK